MEKRGREKMNERRREAIQGLYKVGFNCEGVLAHVTELLI